MSAITSVSSRARPSVLFFLQSHAHHRDLHSFPTRRSSDLPFAVRAPSRHRHRNRVSCAEVGDACDPRKRGGKGRSGQDRKSTRLNSSHTVISYAVFCLKKKN